MAGKTGTTENYGDAWFVGYTPQLAVAVWVGYPTTLKPMLTEFHGDAVTGGSFPALIWKSFMEKALQGEEAQGFPYPNAPYAAPKLVTRRGDRLLLDNGLCKSRQEIVYFAGMGPTKSANCLVNEVEVPDVRRLTARRGADPRRGAAADARGSSTSPRRRGNGSGSSSTRTRGRATAPRTTGSSSSSRRRRTGVIPNLVGKSLDDARPRLKKLKLEPRISWSPPKAEAGDRARAAAESRARRGAGHADRARGRASAYEREAAG